MTNIVVDFVQVGLQFDRSWDALKHRLYPNGNVPVEVGNFFSNASLAFNLLVKGAAYGTQWTTGAAMVEAMTPLYYGDSALNSARSLIAITRHGPHRTRRYSRPAALRDAAWQRTGANVFRR